MPAGGDGAPDHDPPPPVASVTNKRGGGEVEEEGNPTTLTSPSSAQNQPPVRTMSVRFSEVKGGAMSTSQEEYRPLITPRTSSSGAASSQDSRGRFRALWSKVSAFVQGGDDGTNASLYSARSEYTLSGRSSGMDYELGMGEDDSPTSQSGLRWRRRGCGICARPSRASVDPQHVADLAKVVEKLNTDGEPSAAYSKWKALLTPLLFVAGAHKRSLVDEQNVQMMELQAISQDNEFKKAKFKRALHRLTGSTKGLIHPLSPFSRTWKMVVGATVFVACIEGMFNATFTPIQDDGRLSDAGEWIHLVYLLLLDAVFVLDIIVKFRTGYQKLGAVVMDEDLIARHYSLYGGFLPDFVAALPIILFPFNVYCAVGCTESNAAAGYCPDETVRYVMRYVRLLQLFKIRSALQILVAFQDSMADTTNTLITQLGLLLLYFFILTHWFTCFWFVTQAYPPAWLYGEHAEVISLRDDHTWLGTNYDHDPALQGAIDKWTAPQMNGDIGLSDRVILYINCYYWASSAGDAYTAQNTSEKIFAIIMQITIENLFMAYILASIISAMEEFSRDRKKVRRIYPFPFRSASLLTPPPPYHFD